ncbi:glycosyltransferase [Arsukibacterium sp.]|uniref:glycosyltransferase n=1 Tax=Arsukibacterium sp. TaxID=1977258 RepID=UPI001BD45BB7|nr:glycosyltransferase [Arsukibacterium sp.]
MANDTTKTKSSELPRVSMFLFVFQQQDYIEEAISGALAQDYGNLQIVISDDASTDNSAAMIAQAIRDYQGPHDIKVNVNPTNLGIGEHFKHIMNNLIDGELVVAAAGDDISSSKRVSRIVESWLENGKPDVIAHDLREFDQHGNNLDSDRTIQYQWQQNPLDVQPLQRMTNYLQDPFPLPFLGAALAYTRELYQRFEAPKWAPDYEDHLMYFRALLGGSIHYFREPLVRYRRHTANFTNRDKKVSTAVKRVPLGTTPLTVPMASFGQYRMHQLVCQQFEDYLKAIQLDRVCLDVDHFFKLWQNLNRRHDQLLSSYAGWRGKLALLTSDIKHFVNYLPWRWRYGVRQRAARISYLSPIRIIIFGASAAGQRALMQLPEQFEVVAFADNNSKLHGQKVLGIPVISPAQIGTRAYTFDSVLVASIYYFPIKQQLVEQLHVPISKVARASQALISEPSSAHTFRRNSKLVMVVLAAIIGVTITTIAAF